MNPTLRDNEIDVDRIFELEIFHKATSRMVPYTAVNGDNFFFYRPSDGGIDTHLLLSAYVM